MLTHSYYEEDPRVRREAESLVGAGRPVHVFALRRPGDDRSGDVDGVRVTRLDVQRHQGAGIATYLREYLSFFARAGLALVRAHARERFALVQVHSLPDFLVYAGLPVRLTGAPLLIDLHEAMPEFFRSRFPRAAGPLAFRALGAQERASIALATHVLTVNDALVARLVDLGVAPDKITRIRNSPSLARFDPAVAPARPFMSDGTVRLVYTGALTPTYELDVALRAIAQLKATRPAQPITLDVYGRGDTEPALRALAGELGIADEVTFHDRIPIEAVPAAVAGADIGLAPTRHDRFTDVSLSTKILEYAAMGKPAVCSALPMVESVLGADVVWLYRPGDADALAAAIANAIDDTGLREARTARASAVVADMSWERESVAYVDVVERMIAARHR